MSGFVNGLISAVAHSIEPDDVRAARIESRDNYGYVRIAGLALAAIAAVGLVFALAKAMFFTCLLAVCAAVIGFDLEKIGSNGVAMYENYAGMLDRITAAASRSGYSPEPQTVYCEAVYRDTIILGTCLRPFYERHIARDSSFFGG